MSPAFSRAGKALIVVACVAWQYGVYASVGSGQGGLLHLLMLWGPLALLATWVLARSRHKPAWIAALLAAAAAVYFVEQHERLGLAALSGISHATCYLFLLWYFGRTLARGREAIVTRFARRVHGTLAPPMERFTRNVTAAWCIFFAAQLAVSALLLAFAPLPAWSLFVNLLNLPLLALMFTGQFAVRAIRHPDFPRSSPWQAFQAFTQDASLSKSAELR